MWRVDFSEERSVNLMLRSVHFLNDKHATAEATRPVTRE